MTEIELGPRTIRALLTGMLCDLSYTGTKESARKANGILAELDRTAPEVPEGTEYKRRLRIGSENAGMRLELSAIRAKLEQAQRSNFHKDWQHMVAKWEAEETRAHKAEAERDKLAERVKELEFDAAEARAIGSIAAQFGWDARCPITDWLGDSLLDGQAAESDIKRITRERNELAYREHEASEQMRACAEMLDLIGAPKTQDNGLPLHLVGSLSKLISQKDGERWVADLRNLRAFKSEIDAAAAEMPEMPHREFRSDYTEPKEIWVRRLEAYATLMRDTAAGLQVRVKELEAEHGCCLDAPNGSGTNWASLNLWKDRTTNFRLKMNAAIAEAEGLRRENERLIAEHGKLWKDVLFERERLMSIIHAADRAIGDHNAPNDCYATGPMTGDPLQDLVACPACAYLALRKALAPTENKEGM